MRTLKRYRYLMNKKFSIVIFGGRGFVGKEIISLLNHHDHIELKKVFSSTMAGKKVSIYNRNISLSYSETCFDDLEDIDLAILALPNNKSFEYIDNLKKMYPKLMLIDLSSDQRFDSNWYYRIPEISKPSNIKYISNPGCYASAIQFAIEPIKNLIKQASCFGVSGYSGAGSTPNERNDPNTLKDNILPYSLNDHLHQKEVRHHCHEDISFIPHVGDFFRGINITSQIYLNKEIQIEEIIEIYKIFYNDQDLIKITKEVPYISNIAGNSEVYIGGFSIDSSSNSLRVICVLDNLLKGAATQAIQNTNYLLGLNELTGINNE